MSVKETGTLTTEQRLFLEKVRNGEMKVGKNISMLEMYLFKNGYIGYVQNGMHSTIVLTPVGREALNGK